MTTEPATPDTFTTETKTKRYASERFLGATGLNWYTSDPTLQRALRYHMCEDDLEWAQHHLERSGEMMGGIVSEMAELTDKDPPQLVRYDRWGHEVNDVILPQSAVRAKRAILDNRFASRDMIDAARRDGVRTELPAFAEGYMLCQADIGMSCALGTGTAMIQRLVSEFAPPDIREFVTEKFESGEWEGETAQMFTERAGGSDLGALETTATPEGDHYLLNGFKWFASNANGQVYVVLAKPVGAPDNVKGVCSFLVMRRKRDGAPNGIHIRRLKEKLGTKTVASCEIEFTDAEAFLMSAAPDIDGEHAQTGGRPPVGGDGKGLTRMMQMTNDARLGVSMMGLGAARRALVESICYARNREAFGKKLIDHPLMKRKLADMMVDVEAGLAMLLDGYGYPNELREKSDREKLRLPPAIIKLKLARLGITAASDAIEVHGGNGYIETWPVARVLRDAQVNTIWEGGDNILCLDVRRAIERENADKPFLQRMREAVDNAGESPEANVVARSVDDLEAAIEAWTDLDRETAEVRLFPLAQFMGDVYAAALLVEQAEWEQREYGDTRKALVARLFIDRYLADRGPLRGIDEPRSPALDRFDELLAGALADDRAR